MLVNCSAVKLSDVYSCKGIDTTYIQTFTTLYFNVFEFYYIYILYHLISSYLFDSAIVIWVGKSRLIEAILPVICTVLVGVLTSSVDSEYKGNFIFYPLS